MRAVPILQREGLGMAVIKRAGKKGIKYQVRVRGSDGMWITETFLKKSDADAHESKLLHQKRSGLTVRNIGNQATVKEYFPAWNEETLDGGISAGWRKDQIRYFHRFVEPVIGELRLQKVASIDVARVLRRMNEIGLSDQMQLHVYNLLHKMFEDAIELFEILNRNPVIKRLRPSVKVKESRYLAVSDVRRLLSAVKGTEIETAVKLQLYTGLRVGEVQALRWSHLDFNQGKFGKLRVVGTYVRKERRFKDCPKGGQQHSIDLPLELREYLLALRGKAQSLFVASGHPIDFLEYETYIQLLKEISKAADIPWVGTHGLRHSTSEIYLEHGASYDDVKRLFAHSSSSVTDRYIHDRGSRLEKVANVIRLFPELEKTDGSQIGSQNGKTHEL
jgi:integrase